MGGVLESESHTAIFEEYTHEWDFHTRMAHHTDDPGLGTPFAISECNYFDNRWISCLGGAANRFHFTKIKETRRLMEPLIVFGVFLVLWILLQVWVLPKMGVST